MTSNKHAVSFRLSSDGRYLLNELAQWYGISRSGVIEIAIRDKARSKGIAFPTVPEDSRHQVFEIKNQNT